MELPRRVMVNIISWDGGGLSKDIDILADALIRAGCDVWFKGRSLRKPNNRLQSLAMTASIIVKQQLARITGWPKFDINFFIESVFPEFIPMARINALFVNPEWFREEIYNHLDKLDFLLCKTPDGVYRVRELPVKSINVNFSSPDKYIENFSRNAGSLRCLHLSGQSALKGSEAVIEAWSRHNEWPELTVVRRARRYGGEEAPQLQDLPNVRYVTDFVPEEKLRELQNECEVHVIPSLSEGYGHVIGEAMSCAAVVVTTDAPPMNELIGSDRGVLIQVERTETQFRSTLNYVDIDDLELKLDMVFNMSQQQRDRLGQNARKWFVEQHGRFEESLRQFLERVLN